MDLFDYAKFRKLSGSATNVNGGICLPVVELTTIPSRDGSILTEEEAARMNEATATGMPIIVKFNYEVDLAMVLASVTAASENIVMYTGECMDGLSCILYRTNDIWLFMGNLNSTDGSMAVVEITTDLGNGGDVELDQDDAAKFEALEGMPCAVRFHKGLFTYSCVPKVVYAETRGYVSYEVYDDSYSFRIYKDVAEENVWMFSGDLSDLSNGHDQDGD